MLFVRSILTYFALITLLTFFSSCKDDEEATPQPVISSVSPSKARVGVSVTITGQNFSNAGTNTVTFNGTAANISSSSATSITTTVPAGANTGSLIVTADGKSSAPFNFEVLADPPEIESFTPTLGKTGSEVVVTGKNFSSDESSNIVTINSTPVEVKQGTATSLTIVIPANAASGKLSVTLNGEKTTSAQNFTVVPDMVSISPSGGAVNSVVTITGTGLAETTATSIVSFNGAPGELVSNDGQVLKVKVPGNATSGQVNVTVGGITSNGLQFEVGKEVIHGGGTGYDGGHTVAVDALGNMYVAGSFSAQSNFENITLTATNEDGFVAKYNAIGDLLWIKQLTGTNSERVNDMVLDGNGNVYLAGYVSSTDVSFGPLSIIANSIDGFIARINADGSQVWLQTFASDQTDEAMSIALNPSGDVLVTGIVGGDLTIGAASFDVAGSSDVLVAKYDRNNGDPMWAKVFGGSNSDSGNAIIADNSGIYIGGAFFQQFEGAGISPALVTTGELDGFILKLDHSGTVQWAKQIGGPYWDHVLALAIDNNGDCIAGGYFTLNLTVGADITGRGSEDMFLMKVDDVTGDGIWAKGAGSSNYDRITSIVIDIQNNIYTTGNIEGVTLFDDITAGPSVFNKQVFCSKT